MRRKFQAIFQFVECRQENFFNNLQITEIAARQIIGYKYVNLGKMMENIKKGIDAMEAIEQASGTYGRFDEAVKKIDPREE